MSALLESSLFYAKTHSGQPTRTNELRKDQTRSNSLCKKGSIAALIEFTRNPVETLGSAVGDWYDGSTKEKKEGRTLANARKQAKTYEEWEDASLELDELENNNAWKKEFSSPDYYPEELQQYLQQLNDACVNCDVKHMLFLIRTSLSRNLAKMDNLKLYNYSHIGTKDLIERYINTTLETFRALLEISDTSPVEGLGPMEIYTELLAARQSFGRSALLLSGGATFGMSHNGVIKALWEAKLLPRIISGASAGSIVSAVVCSKTDDEIPELLENFCGGDLAVFEAEGSDDSWITKMARLLKIGAIYDISHLTRIMKGMIGDLTFMEAYYRTRRILNIGVSSASVYELPRLLNYVTAPNVVIWSAVAASCSVPFVFSSASLLMKDPKTQEISPWNLSPQKWIDGSVDNDLPTQRLSEMFNVNHFIVSQVNPHVVPFLPKDDEVLANDEARPRIIRPSPSWLKGITSFAKSEAMHRMNTVADLGVFPNALTKAVSVLSQRYSGDITILPEISYLDFPRMLSNPTEQFMSEAMLRGEQATWAKLSRIRNHCAIELGLDQTAHEFRARTVFSSAQEDVRRAVFHRSKSDHAQPDQHYTSARRRRKLSQSSEPDASIFEIAREGRIDHLHSPSHQKSSSLNLASRNRMLGPTPSVGRRRDRSGGQFYIEPFAEMDDHSSKSRPDGVFGPEHEGKVDASRPPFEINRPPSPWPNHEPPHLSASLPTSPANHRRLPSYLSFTHKAPAQLRTPPPPTMPQEEQYKKTSAGKTRASSKARLSPPVEGQEGNGEQAKGGKVFKGLGLEIDMSAAGGVKVRKKK